MVPKKGFTLIELLVVIAIIALLLSIMMPALQNAKYLAQRLQCMSDIKGQIVIQKLYTSDNDGKYHKHQDHSPEYVRSGGAGDSLYAAIIDYMDGVDFMHCPVLVAHSKTIPDFVQFDPEWYVPSYGNWEAYPTKEEMIANVGNILGSYIWLANYTDISGNDPLFKFVDPMGVEADEVPWPKKEAEASSRTAVIAHRISDTPLAQGGWWRDYGHKGSGGSLLNVNFDDATDVDVPVGYGDGSVVVNRRRQMKPRAEILTVGVYYY